MLLCESIDKTLRIITYHPAGNLALSFTSSLIAMVGAFCNPSAARLASSLYCSSVNASSRTRDRTLLPSMARGEISGLN
jgi:hypothetical protein